MSDPTIAAVPGRSLGGSWADSPRRDAVVAVAHGGREVALAEVLVLVGGVLGVAGRRAFEGALLARGHARGEHPRADRAAVGDHGARGEDRAHADARSVLDDAALEQRVVADGDPTADDRRPAAVAVHDRAVLDRRLLADLDVRDVAAEDGAEPDARAVADAHVAGD